MSWLTLFVLACVSYLSLSTAQNDSSLYAHWLPTDLNYALVSNLAGNKLQTLDQAIAGWSILGTITTQDIATWLTSLQQNPNVRSGTVRWNPGVASKCNSGQAGCTKVIKVEVLEFSYNQPNGSDCQAKATIGAAAILPPAAVLAYPATGSTYLPSQYPIQYQLMAAPNATASDCTYVITYPAATQALANTLCLQGNTSCTNSPCQPCNANQTLTTSSTADCLPTSGVAPALVAAIEGAAQCLSVGGMGSFQCQVGFTANNSACSQLHCFPGDARVLLENGKEKQMQDLKIGDRVQVAKKDGKLGFEDVYFFGHREEKAIAPFVSLKLKTRTSKEERHIELSSHHFMNVQRGQADFGKEYIHLRAKDIRTGDKVQIASKAGLEEAEVVSIEWTTKQGLWNPYTFGGNILVNGVLASTHSEWIFDPLFDWMGQTQYLPAFYQTLLAPVRVFYHLLGPQAISKLDSHFNFGRLLTSISMGP